MSDLKASLHAWVLRLTITVIVLRRLDRLLYVAGLLQLGEGV